MRNDTPTGTPEDPFLKRVMLVVDGSQTAEYASQFAFRLAKQLKCPILAAYAIDTATMDYLLQMHIFVSDERQELEESLESKGRSYLERARQLGELHGVEVEPRIVRGRFHQALLQLARQNRMDAIIIGGWRRSSHDKDTFSTERELIMDLAECPVFVIKNPV